MIRRMLSWLGGLLGRRHRRLVVMPPAVWGDLYVSSPIRVNAMGWDEWKRELERVVGDSYGPRGPIVECGEEGWYHYYLEGYTPKYAFEADLLCFM